LTANQPAPTITAETEQPTMTAKNRYNRHAFFRFIGVSLVIATSLMMLVLVGLRRVGGLG
jgi:hypothetical protein